MKIYLLTPDGHRDSVDLERYATNSHEIEELLKNHLEEVGDKLIEIETIDYKKGIIYYTYCDLFDVDIANLEVDTAKYYFITLEKI
jgi:hypothetical protein